MFDFLKRDELEKIGLLEWEIVRLKEDKVFLESKIGVIAEELKSRHTIKCINKRCLDNTGNGACCLPDIRIVALGTCEDYDEGELMEEFRNEVKSSRPNLKIVEVE